MITLLTLIMAFQLFGTALVLIPLFEQEIKALRKWYNETSQSNR